MKFEEMENEEVEELTCKGRVYRYREKQYTTRDGGIHFHQSITPLKRMSCKGCGGCGWQDDELNSGQDFEIQAMEDFDLCMLCIVDEGTDYYGEHDYHCEFKKIEEPSDASLDAERSEHKGE